MESGLNSPHIRFYISDYGYGHASRSIALIRALQKELHAKVSIRTKNASDFMCRSLPACEVFSGQNDIGTIMYEDTLTVDSVATERHLVRWIDSWDTFVAEECDFCCDHGVDLIVSDITPQAFLVSERLGVPGIGFSNFTWELIFRNLYGNSPEVNQIRDAYHSADMAFVLPFHEPMNVFRRKIPVPLVCRECTRSQHVMRRLFGIDTDDQLVYLGSGFSVGTNLDCLEMLVETGVKVLLSGNTGVQMDGIITIPNDDTESQDYLGMCDLIVTKPGYSTVAEAVSTRVPLLIYARDGFAEDPYIIDPIVKNGLGHVLSYGELSSGEWISELNTLFSLKDAYASSSDIFKTDGTDMCIQHIGLYL